MDGNTLTSTKVVQNQKDWTKGFSDGLKGVVTMPYNLSYLSGLIEGKAKRARGQK